MTDLERTQLRERIGDLLHAVAHIVVLPVLLGAVLAHNVGWQVGTAAFAVMAAWGVWIVYTRYLPSRDDEEEEWI